MTAFFDRLISEGKKPLSLCWIYAERGDQGWVKTKAGDLPSSYDFVQAFTWRYKLPISKDIYDMWAPISEWHMARFVVIHVHQGPRIRVLWWGWNIMCLKYSHYSRLVCEHNWKGLCNFLKGDQTILTPKAYEFFISTFILKKSAWFMITNPRRQFPNSIQMVKTSSVQCNMLHGGNMQTVLVPYK